MRQQSYKFNLNKFFSYKSLLLYLLMFLLFACNSKEKKVIKSDNNIKTKCYNLLYNELNNKENFWVSIHAAEALTLAGKSDTVIKVLNEKLKKEKDGRKICGIAREFIRAGDKSKVQLLINILKDEKYSYAHVHACESLYKVNEIGDKQLLFEAMKQETNPNKRVYAAAALGKHGNEEAMKIIRKYLKSDDPEISARAAWILARIGDVSDISNLKNAYKKFENEKNIYEFENALAMLGNEEGLKYLKKNLNSEKPVVREEAVTFAGEMQAVEYKKEIIKLLDDPNVGVRVRAAQTILSIF